MYAARGRLRCDIRGNRSGAEYVEIDGEKGMSLQVWLPLTKDLRNQGLSNVTVTNNGATFNSAGKLGGCYNLNNSVGIGATNITLGNTFSIACWIKVNSYNSDWANAFKIYKDSYDYIGLCMNQTSASTKQLGFHIYKNNGSNARTSVCDAYYMPLTIGVWYHLCFVVTPSEVKTYQNGANIRTGSITTTFPSVSNYNLGLGKSSLFGGLDCSMNDFRLYNHALSQMEVKELSKGLVLHYPLNRGGWGQENYAKNTETSTSTNGTGYSLSSTIPTGTRVTISCYIDANNIVMSGNKRIGLSSSQTKTDGSGTNWFECWASYSNGLLKDNGSFHGWVSNTTILPGPMSSIGAYIQNLTSGTVTISKIKVELGDKRTPWCPNSSDELATTMGLNSTIEYDCSGFCNNGNKMTNTMTYNSDTAKYQVSTHFNGTYDGILIENLQLSDIINTAVTYAFWIKPEGESGARSVYFGSFSGTSWSIEKTTGNVLRLYWNGSPDETCSGATITDGVWQHICITKNGTSNVRVYINGVQKWTSTATHSALTFPTTYRIGRDTRSNDGTPYKGLMSDFRIYATALSADDVKSLYQNSAYIDSSGNVYGAMHEEG